MELLLQALIDGIALGMIYGLAALGLSLAFGVMHIINVAHGDLIILGAFMTYILLAQFHVANLPLMIALSIVAAAILGFLGYLFQRFVVMRIISGPPLATLLLFFGLMMILPNLIIIIWGPYTRTLIVPELNYSVEVQSFKVSVARVFSIAIASTFIILFMLILYKTRIGSAIRATAQNREGAMICGINIRNIYSITLALSFFLAGFSGFLIGLNFAFAPSHGVIYTLLTFLIVVFGGMGYPPGAVVAGLIIGLIQSLISTYLGTTFVYAIIFLILYVTLLVRPRGIVGRGV